VISNGEIFTFVSCMILSGFFSGSEAAIISVDIERAKQLIEEGGRKAKALLYLIENQSIVLTTILVGNNLVNIFAASLTTAIAQRYFQNDAIAISTGITTILIMIFGEILPKTFARSKSEQLVYPVIKVLQIIYILLFPFIKFFIWIIDLVLGDHAKITGRLITKDDIEYMVNKAVKEKTIDSKQLDLLNSILEFPTIKVKDIMIARNKVVFIDKELRLDDIADLVSEDIFSRYPVCENDLDNTLGVMHIKDIAFLSQRKKSSFHIEKYLKKPFFVYEHMKIQSVFDHMNRRKLHMALVKDETGLVVGLITLEDIIEEIMGEIQDEHDDEEFGTPINKGLTEGVEVEASISLRDLFNDYNIKIPLNDNYSTVMGFLLEYLGNTFPKEGQLIVWEGYSFEILEVKNYEIRKVKIVNVGGDRHLFSKKESSESSEGADE